MGNACCGRHFQLARGKKSSPYHDSVAAGAEVATPLDRLWANKDPAGDVESMAENGQSAETIAAKLSGDKANYHNCENSNTGGRGRYLYAI
jgi:hypothetical protein